MKAETQTSNVQKQFNFTAPHPRPFLANLPAKINTYEEGVARFFHWMTGLDYYLAVDQIVDVVVDARRMKVIDLLTDTATFALRLAGRKAFVGRIYSFDTNVTLLERAKQRAIHLNLQQAVEFRQSHEPQIPVIDGYGEIAVSFFDFHRHSAQQFLAESMRILVPDGLLIVAEILTPESTVISLPQIWRKLHLRYVQKNPLEARSVYYSKEEIIKLFFKAGFRQVIIQGLSVPKSPQSGVFSLIVATK